MTDLFPITRADAIGELRRELHMRRNAYPRFIERGQLTADRAEQQIARLEKAIELLEAEAPAQAGEAG